MATLKYVRDAKDTGFLLLGIIEEGEFVSYMLNLKAYAQIGAPRAGDEIDSDKMETVKQTDQAIRARKKALNLLSYADNNKKNLSVKLRRAGFSQDVALSTCKDMEELGYINERHQIERLIVDYANRKLRGPKKIVSQLMAKGYSLGEIKETLSVLTESGEVDFSANAKLLLQKKLVDPSDENEKKKILYKNGYNV